MATQLDDNYDQLFKLVIAGDTGAGKSSLLARFCQHEFDPQIQPTIGVEFATRDMVIDGKRLRAQLWDTAGLEHYRAITSAYYKNATGMLLVYDVTSRKTFEKLPKFLAEVRVHGPSEIVAILVGNKIDISTAENRQVSIEEAINFADQEGLCAFIETSAANNVHVEHAFSKLMTEVYYLRKSQKQIFP